MLENLEWIQLTEISPAWLCIGYRGEENKGEPYWRKPGMEAKECAFNVAGSEDPLKVPSESMTEGRSLAH